MTRLLSRPSSARASSQPPPAANTRRTPRVLACRVMGVSDFPGSLPVAVRLLALKWFIHARKNTSELVLQLPESKVVVMGAGGSLGHLVAQRLLSKGYEVHGIIRNPGRTRDRLGDHPGLFLHQGDLRHPDSYRHLLRGAAAVISCTGTTAFPSQAWRGGNGPMETELVGPASLIAAVQTEAMKGGSLGRFVLVSSAGTQRYHLPLFPAAGPTVLPYRMLNAWGVLSFKRATEERLRASGLPFSIFRPGMLLDEHSHWIDRATMPRDPNKL